MPRARVLGLVLLGLLFAATAVSARSRARSLRPLREEVDPHVLLLPPSALRIASLGYNELLADLLWVRALVYYGDGLVKHHGMPDLEQLLLAINRLDPAFRRPYLWGAHALTFRSTVATPEEYVQSVAVLRRAVARFPRDWEFAWLLGLRLSLDLRDPDPDGQRALKEEGAEWFERAMRMPGAPGDLASLAATMRTKLGQRERALRELREMIYTTLDPTARQTLVRRYAMLSSSDEAAAEIKREAEIFELAWQRDLPYIPASLYLLLGPPLAPGFHLPNPDRTVQTE